MSEMETNKDEIEQQDFVYQRTTLGGGANMGLILAFAWKK